MIGPWNSPCAFRVALERRLLTRARQTGRPLDRLRKEVAHQRLLVRLLRSAPPGIWALEGGFTLLAHLGDRARATSDADANWRATRDEPEATLDQASVPDLGDGFTFQIGRGRPVQGETTPGAIGAPWMVFGMGYLDGARGDSVHPSPAAPRTGRRRTTVPGGRVTGSATCYGRKQSRHQE